MFIKPGLIIVLSHRLRTAGALGASAVGASFKYYYTGNVNNLKISAFQGGDQWQGGITVGEGLNVGMYVSWLKYKGDYIVGEGAGAGVGIGLPVSGQATWNFTRFW